MRSRSSALLPQLTPKQDTAVPPIAAVATRRSKGGGIDNRDVDLGRTVVPDIGELPISRECELVRLILHGGRCFQCRGWYREDGPRISIEAHDVSVEGGPVDWSPKPH